VAAWRGDIFEPFGDASRQLGSFVRGHLDQVVDLDVRFSTSEDMGWQPDLKRPSASVAPGTPPGFMVWEQCSSARYQVFIKSANIPDLNHCFGTLYFPTNGFTRNGVIAAMKGRYRVGRPEHDQQFGSTQSLLLCAARKGKVPDKCMWSDVVR
jgi:hypothetical protein